MSTEAQSLVSELQRTSNRNVFVMMRYRDSQHFQKIESAIRDSLKKYGLIARLAKDRALVDDLWDNVVLYMRHSRFGLVLFEEIDEREFNPNISLELGYMYALGRRCLLLKEKRMPRLPTDICGRIYRNFDLLDLSGSASKQIEEWCENDLGMSPADTTGEAGHALQRKIVYDNRSEDPEFRSWGVFATDLLFEQHLRLRRDGEAAADPGSGSFMDLSTEGAESVGINKAFKPLRGRASFEYKALFSKADNPNLLFCMIPMQGKLGQLIEVGAKERSEPANAYSPYREKFFVPDSHVGDGQWHQEAIDFDFRGLPQASYSIFAPRVNEGCPRPGAGQVFLGNVELLVPIEDDVGGEIKPGDSIA